MDSLLPTVEDLLARVADQEILSRFNKLTELDIHYKDGRRDIVTTADLEAENRIREGLLKIMPDSVVIGEEDAFKNPDILNKLNGSTPVWLVDPVDGTRNFSNGKACFAVICALVVDGVTQMGWILDPVAGACIYSQKGHGTYLGEQKLNLNFEPDDLQSLTGSLGECIQERFKKSTADDVPERLVRYHCVGREYMDLALGKIHFALYGGKMMPWDHAAGVLMVQEAGGYARTINGERDYSPRRQGSEERLLIAPNASTFKSLLQLI